MTLEEAIKHCEDVADYDCFTDEQRKCSDDHRQLADWLRDYKRLLEEPEIIRCKDCKHYRSYAGIIDGYCDMAEWYGKFQNPNDFCSRAERRTQ